MSTLFLTFNRNKKSVVINLKTDAGRALFYDLGKVSDVVIDNFRAGVLERLKVDYGTLSPINPRIIQCSVTGFGAEGAYKDYPALDIIIQAISGYLAITGEAGRPPARVGIPLADLCGGIFSCEGILAALYQREQTGRGQDVGSIAIDPGTPSNLYVGTGAGVFRSTDGGVTFTPTGIAFTEINQFAWTVVVDPQSPNTVHAATSEGIFKSTDSGLNWRTVAGPRNAIALALDPANPRTLYAGTGYSGGPFGSRDVLFKSMDGGETWRPSSAGPSRRTALLAGVFAALAVLTEMTYAVYLFIFGLVYVLWRLWRDRPTAFNAAQLCRHVGNKVIEWPIAAAVYPVVGFLGWHLAYRFSDRPVWFVLGIAFPSISLGLTIWVGGIVTQELIESLAPYYPRPVDVARTTLKAKFFGIFRCQTYWLLATRGAWRVLWAQVREGRFEPAKTDRVSRAAAR